MSRKIGYLYNLLVCISLLCGCGNLKSETMPTVPVPATIQAETALAPLGGSGEVARVLLTYDDLIKGFQAVSPIDESAFLIPEDAAATEFFFEGRLELLGEAENGDVEMLRFETEWLPEGHHLPEFDFEFVQCGSYFVPVQRGQIITSHPYFNYILEPGRIWQENGDQGASRASFPFALVFKGSNAIFNGVMSFLFDGETVSKVWYQITQETTSSTRANFWGLLEAQYHPGITADAEQVRKDFALEMENRFPTKPLEQLAIDYPGVELSAMGDGVSPQHITWSGFVINGINYVSGCQTRFGQYAYCEHMRAASYSTAKSVFASVALMRLAQKYGPEVADMLIKDYVPEAATSAGDWTRVTFDDTLDMATGNYRSDDYMQDEDGETMGEFFSAQPYAARIAAAFVWPHSGEEGEHWVYHTSDTFIVTRAMHNFLQSKEGAQADIFQMVVDEVYLPIGIGPGALSSMRTADDSWQGQAEGGYGLWWIPDDIAKITTLLLNGGRVGDTQILHPGLLEAALQQNPRDRGVSIDGDRMYNNAFWAQRIDEQDGYECEFWVTQMYGVSGNVVLLMPNGSVYYYFSDNKEFSWDAMVRESNKIKPFCP